MRVNVDLSISDTGCRDRLWARIEKGSVGGGVGGGGTARRSDEFLTWT